MRINTFIMQPKEKKLQAERGFEQRIIMKNKYIKKY